MKNKITEQLRSFGLSMRDVFFFVGQTYRLNPAGILLKIPELLLQVLPSFLSIFLVREVLNSIQRQIAGNTILLWILSYIVFDFLVRTLQSWIHVLSERQMDKTARLVHLDMTKRIIAMPYAAAEDPRTRTFVQMLRDNISIADLLSQISNLLKTLFTMVGVTWIICTLQPLLIFLIIAVLLVRTIVNSLTRRLWNKWREPVNDSLRKVRYFLGVLEDVSYGKEIRMGGLQKWISQKMKTAENGYTKTMRDYNRALQRRNVLIELAGVLQEFVVYLRLSPSCFYPVHR